MKNILHAKSFAGKNGFACFIDLKKAFVTIDHESLLRKLSLYDFRGQVNRLLDSSLSHRCQLVQIGNSISDTLSVPCGVPQGSVLGPLLFLSCINDLSSSVRDCQTLLFANPLKQFNDYHFIGEKPAKSEIVARIKPSYFECK